MLVLAGRMDDVFTIGPDIEIMIVSSGRAGGQVRLGIKAPKEVPIGRKGRARENREAEGPDANGRVPAEASPGSPGRC